MTATLAAGTLVSMTPALKSRRERARLRKTIYAPIDEHCTTASNRDIATAWLAVGLAGAGLLGMLGL